jgi:phosphatidylglycerol---prolipoprotein diacylglyceryl transferase
VLLAIWNGLSSVGGFFGAWIGMVVYLKMHKQPIMPYADGTIYGLVLGWCFGRLGCSVVHDHPGKVVEEGTFLAVGPWPDGSWRYDLGLLEFMFACMLCVTVYFVIDWKSKRPGWLVGFVAVAYAPFRFALDFFRADEAARGVIGTPDIRYVGLTTAQWFTVLFALVGLWLMFMRKERASDLAYATNTERIAREKAEAEKAAADDDSSDGEDEDEAEAGAGDDAADDGGHEDDEGDDRPTA